MQLILNTYNSLCFFYEPPLICNLPTLRDFVGREEELEQAERLLLSQGRVTLTGPSGTGKSALACVLAFRQSQYSIVLINTMKKSVSVTFAV